MIKEPSKWVAARAALNKAAANLGDPDLFDRLASAVSSILGVITGAAPQIEKDIAQKLVLAYRNKVLSEVKVMLANFESYEAAYLAHWYRVMALFVDARLPDNPEFNACKEQLLKKSSRPPLANLKALQVTAPNMEMKAARRENDHSLRLKKEEVRTMLHSKSLRVIGQSLEMLRVQTFRLEKSGDFYIVQSELLTATHQWIVRNNLADAGFDSTVAEQNAIQVTVGDGRLRYGPRDIARLNARQLEKRGNHGLEQTGDAHALARLLCALGEYLDNKRATAFEISWTPNLVSVDYQTRHGVLERKDFSLKKLQQLALFSRFRRANRNGSMGSVKKPAQ